MELGKVPSSTEKGKDLKKPKVGKGGRFRKDKKKGKENKEKNVPEKTEETGSGTTGERQNQQLLHGRSRWKTVLKLPVSLTLNLFHPSCPLCLTLLGSSMALLPQWFTLATFHTKEGDEISTFLVPCLQSSISTLPFSFLALFSYAVSVRGTRPSA